jgi:transposase
LIDRVPGRLKLLAQLRNLVAGVLDQLPRFDHKSAMFRVHRIPLPGIRAAVTTTGKTGIWFPGFWSRTGKATSLADRLAGAIAAFVRSKAPGAIRIGLETGPTATWLWTELKQLGLPVICIDARHAKAVLKMQINKSERNDAAGIARIMQTSWFKECASRTSIAPRLELC